ncbi:MAG: lysophospholipid acyltransferase family protein [Myxococcota bacterium]|nr:lysophospholipid acyltransferase family protein [Myxococcota bacterium]
MPFPPLLARTFAAASLTEEDRERFRNMHFHDAGHGYDVFGMHPDFVGLGVALTRPLYRNYFRVKSYGAERIPDHGPAILAANHSGNLPVDGAMLWADVVEHTNPVRVPRPVADHFVPALPFIGTLFARGGVVGGSRGNARTLLEQGDLLMIFPEGVPGIVKPWSERYKLREFRVGHSELAIRHGAKVVPVGIVGAEEQMPQLFSSRRLGKPFGVPVFPVPAVPIPLPVRYHIHYGEPLDLGLDYRPGQADDPEVVQEAAALVQQACQALIDRGLEMREGIFK